VHIDVFNCSFVKPTPKLAHLRRYGGSYNSFPFNVRYRPYKH